MADVEVRRSERDARLALGAVDGAVAAPDERRVGERLKVLDVERAGVGADGGVEAAYHRRRRLYLMGTRACHSYAMVDLSPLSL